MNSKNLVSALILIVGSVILTGCDQKPTAQQIDCSKQVKDMSKSEMDRCGKGGHFSSGENKKW